MPEPKAPSPIFIGRWTPRILFSPQEKPHRHGQLRPTVGSVSQRMLTRTLRSLVSSGRNCILPSNVSAACRQGVRFGVHCSLSCANLTTILLVIGVMNLRAMAVVMAAITLERLAPAGQRVAQVMGVVIVAAGFLLIVQAAGIV